MAASPRCTPALPTRDSRFQNLLPPDAWNALPYAVQRRFSKRVSAGRTIVYIGLVTAARFSRLGWLLAQAARMIGGPLPTSGDTSVPAIVTVTEDRVGGGQIWTRVYARRRGFPQVINSAKRFTGPTGLAEDLGFGLGMALLVEGEARGLAFRSAHFYVALLGRRVRLPRWLTPGDVLVRHIDTGGGRFVFTLELRHPLAGLLFYQEVEFADPAGPP